MVKDPTHDLFFGKIANFLCDIVDFSVETAMGGPGGDMVLSLVGETRAPVCDLETMRSYICTLSP